MVRDEKGEALVIDIWNCGFIYASVDMKPQYGRKVKGGVKSIMRLNPNTSYVATSNRRINRINKQQDTDPKKDTSG